MKSKRLSTTEVITFFIAVIALGVLLAASQRVPVASSEVRFADVSATGIGLIPASCPSSPHYSGQCTPPGQPSSGCVIQANPSSITAGNEVVISWSTISDYGDPYARSISPTIGSVAWSGSSSVKPNTTTTYTLTGTHSNSASNFSCSTTVTVTGGSCTPSYSCQGNDLYYTNASCSNSLVQACAWGCSYGACLLPPDPTGEITANPAVVRSGRTSQITWAAENVESCTVTEDNPDISNSWTGVSGTRTSGEITQLTTYTLRCIDLSGGEFLDYAKVNVIPIWEEQ